MYRSVVRGAPRRIASTRPLGKTTTRTRFLSTAPPSQKSRSWKGFFARWGIAAGGLYWYNTTSLFAEEPEVAIQKLDSSIHHVQESNRPTIDAIVAEKRRREEEEAAQVRRAAQIEEEEPQGEGEGEEGLEGLEEEADQQGAFNPETGEINWDCPCLGGMAHGPCGDEFRAAFSCFVYSDQEPKGVECIEKFKGMQDCFRAHPEMYGSELEDDEDEIEEELRAQEAARIGEEAASDTSQGVTESSGTDKLDKEAEKSNQTPQERSRKAGEAENTGGKPADKGDVLVSKEASDAQSK